jgi:magnesium chelatase family protein
MSAMRDLAVVLLRTRGAGKIAAALRRNAARVDRLFTDLGGSEEIKPQHIAEAVGYRSLDRSVWM